MASIAGAAVIVISEVIRGTRDSVRDNTAGYDGRPIPWTTMFVAALAAALHAPLIAGALLAWPAAWEIASDDLMVIVGAPLLGLVVGLFFLAVSFVFIGVAVGSAVLVDRPQAWWYARAWAALGLFFGWFVWWGFGSVLDDGRVIGSAMLAIATSLLALSLPPRRKPQPLQSRPRRRRFVL